MSVPSRSSASSDPAKAEADAKAAAAVDEAQPTTNLQVPAGTDWLIDSRTGYFMFDWLTDDDRQAGLYDWYSYAMINWLRD